MKSGAGTMRLTNNLNSYSGRTYINQGVLQINSTNVLGINSPTYVNNQVIIDGGTLQYSGPNALWWTNRGIQIGNNGDNDSGTITVDNTLTNRTPIVGGGTDNRLIKAGGGTLRLETTNYFTGGVTINGGTLAYVGTNVQNTVNAFGTVIGDAALGAVPMMFDADNIVINNGTLQLINNANNNTEINALRGIQLGAAGNANPGTIDVNNGTNIYNGVIVNGGTGNQFRKSGGGELRFGQHQHLQRWHPHHGRHAHSQR
ncbi:MAG: hypothetical protein HC814_08205 [Rhodobacteraceae bacterium]|nr:hypothetical protein [Paracoccaceae bacterium]